MTIWTENIIFTVQVQHEFLTCRFVIVLMIIIIIINIIFILPATDRQHITVKAILLLARISDS